MTDSPPMAADSRVPEQVDAASSLLTVRELKVQYASGQQTRQALRGLDLAVTPGQSVGLIGKSGSGKTTAGKAILGLLPRNAIVSGAVSFNGRDLLTMSERERRRIRWEQLAFVPQAAMSALDPVMAIDKQIVEVIRAHRDVDRSTAKGMAHRALERVGINADRAGSFPHQFSGGMRQRVLIAMATVLEPALLVADEPTTGLDVIVQDRTLELLARAKDDLGLSLVVITHDLGVANELCDHVILLEEGRAVAAGPPELVLSTRRDTVSEPVGSVQPAPARATRDDAGAEAEGVTPVDIVDLTVTYSSGRGLAALRRSNKLTVLDGVSLTVQGGEIVGLAGESGCGKSSLISTLVGLTDVAGGAVRIAGQDVVERTASDWRPLRRQIQMVFQDPYDSLNPRLTVWDAVGEPLIAQGLHAVGDGLSRDERIAAALHNAGMTPASDFRHRYPYQLSGGERQRVAVARALVVEPTALLADEPVSMLDEETAAGVMNLLADLARRLRVAVLLVSHDVSLLRRVCDRVAVMYLGRIVEAGPASEVLDSPKHPYTEALVRAVPSRIPGERRERVLLQGEPPSLKNRPTGCAFHPRCPRATANCGVEQPPIVEPRKGRSYACWHPSSDTCSVHEDAGVRRE